MKPTKKKAPRPGEWWPELGTTMPVQGTLAKYDPFLLNWAVVVAQELLDPHGPGNDTPMKVNNVRTLLIALECYIREPKVREWRNTLEACLMQVEKRLVQTKKEDRKARRKAS